MSPAWISFLSRFFQTGILAASVEILQPFILGCDTKHAKIVHLCLTSIQRLIQHQAISMVCFGFDCFVNRKTVTEVHDIQVAPIEVSAVREK